MNRAKLKKSRLITCILPLGAAKKTLEALKNEKKVIRANVSHARGSGMSVPVGMGGVGQQIEKDILTVVVEAKEADELFEFIFFKAKMNRPHGGFMYMSKETMALPFAVPELCD